MEFPVGIYLLKVKNRNTRIRYEICSKLTIKTPEEEMGFILENKKLEGKGRITILFKGLDGSY